MKNVIFTMGGKGGVGKTGALALIIEWLISKGFNPALIDLDIEAKDKGSLQHFFPAARKVNINAEGALDVFVESLECSDTVVADQGAGAGQQTFEWFDQMHEALKEEMQVRFIAVGVVTDDPASVRSVLTWASKLQDRVEYLIVENGLNRGNPEAHYWLGTKDAAQFRKALNPTIIRLEKRLAALENACRNWGSTLGSVADQTTESPELKKVVMAIRAKSYQRAIFDQLNEIESLLTV